MKSRSARLLEMLRILSLVFSVWWLHPWAFRDNPKKEKGLDDDEIMFFDMLQNPAGSEVEPLQ
jgi:hypothetical protein